MKILVIGGSYFLGRWFVEYAHKKHNITVLNRGRVAIGLDDVCEIVADRHDVDRLTMLTSSDDVKKYDCIVDFCAYSKGDIKTVLDTVGQNVGRYIFISTADVYKKHTGLPLDENATLKAEAVEGELGDYLRGKVDLESELKDECIARGIQFCSIRPSIIIGPANYSQREQMYFNWIENAGQIVIPEDGDGYFQLVYVEDLAKFILAICEADNLNEAYNIGNKKIGYEEFAELIRAAVVKPFDIFRLPSTQMDVNNIPRPFPTHMYESEDYVCEQSEEFYMAATGAKLHTDLVEALKKTYDNYLLCSR